MTRKKRKIVSIVCVIMLLLAAAWSVKDDLCARYYNKCVEEKIKEQRHDRISNPANMKAADSGISLLHNGDLVLRTGADVISYMLCQMNQENKTYSHCGLVIVEHGYPFVYHSIGGEDNPDEKLRRDSANFFFSPANNLGFGIARFDADSAHIARLDTVIRRMYKEGHKFDLKFDLSTNDRFYCAEFVYKAVNEAMNDKGYIKTVTRKGFTFVGVDNLFCNSHARLVWQVQYK